MTWLIFKAWVKKTWLWLKEHWQLPFLALWTVVVWILTRRNTEAMLEVVEAKRDSYKKQLEVLRDSHNNEILKRNKLTEEYEEALKRVEEVYIKKEKRLTDSQKNEIKETVIKSKGNPEEIKRKIEKEFGIKYVE